MFTTIRIGNVKGNKHLFINDCANQRDYACLSIPCTGKKVIAVMDLEYYNKLCANGEMWCCSNGYIAENSSMRTMHTMIAEPDDGRSVDHINQMKTDNRFENLRLATQSEQNVNRGARYDKIEPHPDLKALGVEALPRYLRFDPSENKYTFVDHPWVRLLADKGVKINPTGTKSAKCTIVEKFTDCMKKYCEMHEKYYELHPEQCEIDDVFAKRRRRLAMSYNAIVRYAHSVDPEAFPEGPHASLTWMDRDHEYAKEILDMLPVPAKKQLGGPKNIEYTVTSRGDVCVRHKDHTPTVYDKLYEEALGLLNWDHDDMRIHISPAVAAAFPELANKFPGAKKVLLPAFVYHILEGHEVIPDHCVVPFNNIRHDVRVANLMYVPGTSKNYKPPQSLAPPEGVDIGMEYLPRGVTVTKDKERRWIFVTKLGGKTTRAYFTSDNTKAVFEASVLPLLRAHDPDFDVNNARYQRMVAEFYGVN